MLVMEIPIFALLLQGIPEQIAVATLAFAIAKLPFKVKDLVLIGIVLAVTAYLIRLTKVSFGVHIIALIILLFIFLVWLEKGNIYLSLIASLLSFLALAIFEFACLSLLMPIFNITPEMLATDSVVRIAIAEPQVLLLFATAFVVKRFSKK
jgi:hypothetical protein